MNAVEYALSSFHVIVDRMPASPSYLKALMDAGFDNVHFAYTINKAKKEGR